MRQIIEDKQLFLNVKEVSLQLRALNNDVRQKILKMLEENSRLSVTEIFIRLRLLQSITSQHLSVLRRAGVVTTMRQGKNIYYELNVVKLEKIQDFIKGLLK